MYLLHLIVLVQWAVIIVPFPFWNLDKFLFFLSTATFIFFPDFDIITQYQFYARNIDFRIIVVSICPKCEILNHLASFIYLEWCNYICLSLKYLQIDLCVFIKIQKSFNSSFNFSRACTFYNLRWLKKA